MKGFITIITLLAIGCNPSENTKKSAPAPDNITSKYSNQFNQSINKILIYYNNLTEAFINWDSVKIQLTARDLKRNIDSTDFTELKTDSSLYKSVFTHLQSFKYDIDGIILGNNIEKKRHSFNSFSKNLSGLLKSIRYDQSKLYIQECPMAFNDTGIGIWLSKTPEIRNPYLGLHHPKYGKGMLICGETKDSLNYIKE